MAEAAPSQTTAERFYDVLLGGVSKLIDHEIGGMPVASSGMVYTQTPQGGAPGATVDAGTTSSPSIIPGIEDKTVYLVSGVVLLLAVGGWMFARRR